MDFHQIFMVCLPQEDLELIKRPVSDANFFHRSSTDRRRRRIMDSLE